MSNLSFIVSFYMQDLSKPGFTESRLPIRPPKESPVPEAVWVPVSAPVWAPVSVQVSAPA